MATNLKRIEKEFILGAARDDRIPLILIAGSGEWPCFIAAITADGLAFSHAMPLHLLKRGQVYEFRFAYRQQPMAFRARALEVKETSLAAEMPEAVYKNLGRRYSRRSPPAELEVSISFKGDRYQLSFPTTKEFETVKEPERDSAFDPRDIKVLLREFNERASEFATERAVRMFKEKRPETLEERLIVRTGKIYFLPSASGGLPLVDPFPRPRIITRDAFGDFLRDEGLGENLVGDEVLRFERSKQAAGVFSELMIPVLFQEYVIGYVFLINTQAGRPPFDLSLLETYYQFAKILAYSLKVNGYFHNAPKKPRDFSADVIDISAGGLLFSSGSRDLSTSLTPGSEMVLSIKAKGRALKALAKVKRVYRDATRCYFGMEYAGFAPEDFRFLFESLYGRSFTDEDAAGIEGLSLKPRLT